MLKKCLYPVAGYGTRFLPATKSMAKEMLPIVDKPLIQYAVSEAMDAGMIEQAFVTGRTKRTIEDHFDISYELENEIRGSSKEEKLAEIRSIRESCVFTYTRQKEMKGLGHAILTGEPMIGDEPFGVILADDLCITEGDSVMKQMAGLYKQFRCSIVAIEEVPPEETSKYGVIKAEQFQDHLFKIEDMVEKPDPADAPSNLAVIGRYILTPDIFDYIRDTKPGANGEVQITDALKAQAQKGCVMAYRFKGRRFDCGSLHGYVEATNYCYQQFHTPDE
jgi:UTP--glucose-1-phosphate uridylyltransferase